VTTTTSNYLTVSQHLALYQKMTASAPAVKTATNYYSADIGKATTIAKFVGDYRLLSYALTAYGLGDQVGSTALVTQVLEGGVATNSSLANKLANPAWRAFAAAFDFAGKGAASVTSPAAVASAESAYVESQLESGQGQQDVGVQLALYFKRVAPTVTSSYGLMADKNLIEVARTIFDLPPATTTAGLDAQAAELDRLMPVADLKDPKKLEQLTERFTATYDLATGPGSAAPLALTASGGASSAPSAASTILSGIIDTNASGGFSAALLQSLQGVRFGG
jgi:hypothetical protein